MNLKYLKHLAARGASFIHPRGYEATRLLIQKLDIRQGNKILEIGCGTGATLVEISSNNDITIDGLDVLDEMLSAAKDRVKFSGLDNKVKLYKGEINKAFPFNHETYDRIYMESVIGFQTKECFDFMLSEVYRVLAGKGIFAVNEALWNENVSEEIIREADLISQKAFGLGNASNYKIDLKYFLKKAEETGLKPVEVINLNELKSQNDLAQENNLSIRFAKSKKRKTFVSAKYLINEINYFLKQKKISKYSKFVNSYLIVMNKD